MSSPAQPHVAIDDVIKAFDDVGRGPYTVTADDLTRLVFLRGPCRSMASGDFTLTVK